ncbi:biotin/lipoyl-binding protein [Propioniciclava coleopterorum]|uniref:Biotin/lipoyl-binding protein n=1 Tax=Propioniciclava coleopterorum TaxID=2714937 RepID=A0A6G7Y517_9ACTN|nr:biotin/lipoyl-containing protein [Propioniciclava coleopterorum]QIK71721.1 biotin/lipoyl-binding protein [Propioniciclava coleopterorum]
MKLKVTVNGIPYDIEVDVQEEEKPQVGSIVIGGGGGSPVQSSATVIATSANAVTAPLSGSVARILVEEGDEIEAGQVLCVLEAMKMETEITAPAAGKVERILVSKGDAVAGGEALIELG